MKEKIKNSGFVRKFVSIVAAVLMTLGMVGGTAIPAFAAPTNNNSITITDPETGHTYTAYEIFSGTPSGNENETVLSDLNWGTGVNSSALTNALNAFDSTNFPSKATSAADVAKGMEKYSDGGASDAANLAAIIGKHLNTAAGTATDGNISNLESGYYIVTDTVETTSNDTVSRFLLKVVGGNYKVTVKKDTPTLEKKVLENSSNSYQDKADYNIGDDVPFKVYVKIPSNIDQYRDYDSG